MMKKQAGYYNLDFTGFFIALIVLGIIIGLILGVAVPWLWELVKPWIHSITA